MQQYLLLAAIILLATNLSCSEGCKLVCYYDISSASKVGPAKFTPKDMELALHFCTHIIYSYVTLTTKGHTVTAVNPEREHELANMQIFKNKFPTIKFLLSLSGENNWKTTKQFLNLLQADREHKEIFINSIMEVLVKYNFDGLSLDLPLPAERPKAQKNFCSKMWNNFVGIFKSNSGEDTKASAHKDQLTTLIQQLSTNLKNNHGLLTLNMLPNVDPQKYFDIVEIINYLDFVVLSAFDFYTPQNSPHRADIIAPIKPNSQFGQGLPLANVKSLYKYWHAQNVPRNKIIIGIAAFGRSWKMTLKSNNDGIPPVLYTNGAGAPGPQTQIPGFLSWPEICAKLAHDRKLTRFTDEKAKSGVYAYRPANSEGNFGIWISYEDPISAGAKAMYVLNHNLAGVALFHLNLDDVHGECSGEKFPILRSMKFNLRRSLS